MPKFALFDLLPCKNWRELANSLSQNEVLIIGVLAGCLDFRYVAVLTSKFYKGDWCRNLG